MKKILLLFLTLALISLVSCSDNNAEEQELGGTNDETIQSEIIDTEADSEIEEEAIKPSTVDEIIEFANELNIDTSMTAFSLENVLSDAQIPESEDAGDEYQNSTAYLGDSVTLGMSVFTTHPKNMVIAKGSINPLDAVEKNLIELDDGSLVNFPTALARSGAKRAVLTFGSNAISVMDEETFIKYYIKLLDAIDKAAPDCDIIIQSITPLATTSTFKKLTNELVNRSNLLLLVLAYSRDIKFLDTTAHMKDSDGYLKIEYCSSDDGVHINEEGYKIWLNMLRHHKLSNDE